MGTPVLKRKDLKPGTVFRFDWTREGWGGTLSTEVFYVEPLHPAYKGPTPQAAGNSLMDDDVKVVWEPEPVASAPTAILTTDKQARKEMPIARGVVDYFPRALAAIARVSFVANNQHNPGQPMHWDKSKSTDHADCIARHLIERGSTDDDGLKHSAKLAWRALALLETELEAEAQ